MITTSNDKTVNFEPIKEPNTKKKRPKPATVEKKAAPKPAADLGEKTVKELRALAKKMKVAGYSRASKTKLIAGILAA